MCVQLYLLVEFFDVLEYEIIYTLLLAALSKLDNLQVVKMSDIFLSFYYCSGLSSLTLNYN